MKITQPRLLVAIAATLSALILQVTLLARLGLPGATPDLLLVVVLALGMAGGPASGAVMGFAAGLLIDLAPPAAGSLGQTAAVYAIAGYLAGNVVLEPGRPELAAMLTIAGLAGAVVIALPVLSWLLGSPQAAWSEIPFLFATQALYAAVLAMVIVPLVGVLYRGAAEEGRTA